MAKKIQLSSDDVSFLTLPGNSGDVSNEAGQLPDTIFGQNFSSNFPGLIGWSVSANGIFKGFAGYMVSLKINGTSTTTTNEACTLISGKTYQITDSAKEIIDRASTIVVKDNGTTVAASNILSFDYLFGKVTFVAGYTVTGPITITYKYMPMSGVAGAKTFTLTQTAESIDETTITSAQVNDGHRTFNYGLKTISLDLGSVYALSNNALANLKSRNEFVVEISPDGAGAAIARGFFRFTNQSQSGGIGELEEESVNLSLSVPDDNKLVTPFAWNIGAGSTLSPAIQLALTAWEDSSDLYTRYLPDGTAGVEGAVIVTDLSLSGGLEVMSEFTVNLQGSGQISAL